MQKRLPRSEWRLPAATANRRIFLGLDCAFPRSIAPYAVAAAVLWDGESRQLIHIWQHRAVPPIPYVPGLLGFREVPLMLAVLEQVDHSVDAILVDGQGIAHPRRLGSAAHLSLWLEAPIPVIGVGKTRLVGDFESLPADAGTFVSLIDKGELVGKVLRSRKNCRPLFISPGGHVDIDGALAIVRGALCGFRLPEPIRLADQAAGQQA
ncbi:MAG: endonuclease V [Mariprofundaceae bacterium]